MDYDTDSSIDIRETRGSMNTSTTMLDIDRETIEKIDLSTDQSTGNPKMGKLIVDPLHQKHCQPRKIRYSASTLDDVFLDDGYGKTGNARTASPSTLRGPRDMGGSNINYTSNLDYFDDAEDVAPDTPTKPKPKGRIQANGTENYSKATPTHNYIASAAVKKRKLAGRLSRAEAPGLFMSPTPEKSRLGAPGSLGTSSKAPLRTESQIHERSAGMPRKTFEATRTISSQAPPLFEPQSRNIFQSNQHTIEGLQSDRYPTYSGPRNRASGKQQPLRQLQPEPQLPPRSGIEHFDIQASLVYMEKQIERTSMEIVQPVIDLTKMVKKLQLENSVLHEQIRGLQMAVKKSISEMHDRQDEHEDLIDRLSSSSINPAGTPYGGPRHTAGKKRSLFQGMLSGNFDGISGS